MIEMNSHNFNYYVDYHDGTHSETYQYSTTFNDVENQMLEEAYREGTNITTSPRFSKLVQSLIFEIEDTEEDFMRASGEWNDEIAADLDADYSPFEIYSIVLLPDFR